MENSNDIINPNKEHHFNRNKMNLNNPEYFKEVMGVLKKGLKKSR